MLAQVIGLRPIPLPRSQLEVGTGEHEPAGYHRQFTLVYGRVTLDTGGFFRSTGDAVSKLQRERAGRQFL